ncbi:polysaccharide biosynthesis protein [Nitratifractor sp.]
MLESEFEKSLSQKTVLLTGGTGSFGNAFIRRFLDTDIKKIIVFSRDEEKQDHMRHVYCSPKIKYVIGDVRDKEQVREVMHGVDAVFHAAALKQVPSCEFAPIEATKTNVLGTDNVLAAAIEADVADVVCLSTGKAVYPINAMGLSKALMEKTIVNRARQINEWGDRTTKLKYIRFSNVFATRGSAINIFTRQIKECRPVTVTNPQMRRSIMTMDEAVDLALFAMNNGGNGDLFIYKARRTTLQQLVEFLFDIYDAKCREIKVIGARHGEKMEETILSEDELRRAIDMGDFVRVFMDRRGLNYMNEYDGSNRRNENTPPSFQLNVKELTKDYLAEIIRKHEQLPIK